MGHRNLGYVFTFEAPADLALKIEGDDVVADFREFGEFGRPPHNDCSSGGHPTDDLIDLALGRDVDAASRFFLEHQDLRRQVEPPRDQQFLLSASGQRLRQSAKRARFNGETPQRRSRFANFSWKDQPLLARNASRSRQIIENWERGQDTFLRAVAGDVADAASHRFGR